MNVDERQPALPPDIEAKYDNFILTLKVSLCFFEQTSYRALQKLRKPTLPGSYLDLTKQAARIRRLFEAQAFALVTLCRSLADRFMAIKDCAITVECHFFRGVSSISGLPDNFIDLDVSVRAFNEALVAFQTAAGTVSTLRAVDLT